MPNKFLKPIVGKQYKSTVRKDSVMTVTLIKNKVVYLEGTVRCQETGDFIHAIRYCNTREFSDFYAEATPTYKGGSFHKVVKPGDATRGIILLPSISVTGKPNESFEIVCADEQNRKQLEKSLRDLGGLISAAEGDKFIVNNLVYTKPVEQVYGK